jgi:ATP-dependent DNA helicase RecQ
VKQESVLNFDLFNHNQDRPREILRDTFGFDNFRGQQEQIIQHIYSGGDALVLMPTGGGKSLCYQIPALAREGMGVVISPLISLMQDQVSSLQENGVNAVFLNSTLSLPEVREIERQIINGEIELLYMAPERLVLPRTIELLGRVELSLFAIDESHCVSKWGHDFRPEYMQLGLLQRNFSHVPRVALTATADLLTRKEIVTQLNLQEAKIFLSSFDRPNITYLIEKKVSQKGSFDQLLSFTNEFQSNESGIVYCLSRKRVEEVAEFLVANGKNAYPYHAGLSNNIRKEHQDNFLYEEGVIVVATIAFGMGIDKPDVRFVAHMDLPKSIEGYYQETGRAGRDGLPAVAWMAYGLREVQTLKMLIRKNSKNINHRQLQELNLETMLSICETTVCRRKSILNNLDEETKEFCGNCDICLGSLDDHELYNGSEEAILFLSLVHKTRQKFGFPFLMDILLGSHPSNSDYPHFGDGANLDFKAWAYVFRQLIAANMIKIDYENQRAIKLTEYCVALIKREISIYFKENPNKLKSSSSSKKKAKKKVAKKAKKKRTVRAKKSFIKKTYDYDPGDKDVFESLKSLRSKLAKSKRLPAYKIFHDSALLEMAAKRPSTDEEFLDISGVGSTKLKKYGVKFMDIIADF